MNIYSISPFKIGAGVICKNLTSITFNAVNSSTRTSQHRQHILEGTYLNTLLMLIVYKQSTTIKMLPAKYIEM